MYCPYILEKKRYRKYIKPYSPRLTNTIFSMDKKQLKRLTINESPLIKKFVNDYDDNRTLLDIYKNLANESYTVSKRIRIKNWLDKHGAIFYSLNILEGYRWVKFVGKGSYSSAHLIEYNNDRKVIKITINKKNYDKDKLKLFKREIEILKSINHPYIIKLYDYNELNEDVFWSLNDYCNLGSLDNLIKDLNYTTIPTRHRFIEHIIEAIMYIHSKDIIHRDIKPANILINGYDFMDPRIIFKLGDFNLSRIIENDNEMSFCGTKNYMAPEVINKIQYNEKVDIWSFLCVLIELGTLKNINPILMSKLDLNQVINKLSDLEIILINMMHKTNAYERPSAEKVKLHIMLYMPIKPLNVALHCHAK